MLGISNKVGAILLSTQHACPERVKLLGDPIIRFILRRIERCNDAVHLAPPLHSLSLILVRVTRIGAS